METKLVSWFSEIGQGDDAVFGKKCANLGEMTRLKMPVPLGFAISVSAQEKFLEETGALREIQELLSRVGDLRDINLQAEVSREIHDIIVGKELPSDLYNVIGSYYDELCSKRGREAVVSVRSAGVKSHPGMYETYLNIGGKQKVLDKVKRVWGSAFNSRTIAARVQQGLPIADSPCIGVGVVEMVNARCAGVCFTVHPITGDTLKAMIEANWGLGESVVGGKVSIDMYVVDKESMKVIEKTLGEKKLQIVPKEEGVVEDEVHPEKQAAHVLSDEEAAEIVRMGKALESYFNQPQDLEWAIDDQQPFPQNIYLLQTRPVVGVKVQKLKTSEKHVIDDLLKKFF
ncbi:MAG: hypothetical protein C4554_05330 [Dethiobacter sp.]|jgi:pyruvate,water dikinase|nr:MAG: hypothetical protein C4554_05330 [Dethiobacter sp.]